MIKISMGDWEGIEGSGDEILRSMMPAVEHSMERVGITFDTELKRTLSGPRSGRTYRVSRTGAIHVASAPGEPPAVLFGILRGSVGHTRPEWKGFILVMEVGTGLGRGRRGGEPSDAYARRLEWGGVDSRGVYIAPRPYMEPTVERIETMIDGILRRDLT